MVHSPLPIGFLYTQEFPHAASIAEGILFVEVVLTTSGIVIPKFPLFETSAPV